MLQALLRGKLSREQENMEDILTSNVFGLMKYLPPEEALFPFLARARDLDDGLPLAFLRDVRDGEADYDFWPPWRETGCIGCEPDAVIRVTASGQNLLLLIEAKFHSGKSSEADERIGAPPRDQLAREWDNLVARARRKKRTPWLLYVTADMGTPVGDIRESLREYTDKRPGRPAPSIIWLSWRSLLDIFGERKGGAWGDLHALARRLGLQFYRGVHPVAPLAPGAWSFSSRPVDFVWSITRAWRPRPAARGLWSFPLPNVRFHWGESCGTARVEWGFER